MSILRSFHQICSVKIVNDALTQALHELIKPIIAEAMAEVTRPLPELLKPKELAEKLSVPVSWVYEQSKAGITRGKFRLVQNSQAWGAREKKQQDKRSTGPKSGRVAPIRLAVRAVRRIFNS